MLGGDHLGKFIDAIFEGAQEAIEYAGATKGRGCGPARKGQSCCFDRGFYVRRRSQSQCCRLLTGSRVKYRRCPPALAWHQLAVDEVRDRRRHWFISRIKRWMIAGMRCTGIDLNVRIRDSI